MAAQIFFISLFIAMVGCTPAPPRGNGSFLIIAISNFRADDLTCGLSGDSITPQIDTICKESVRFTHAYTPSVLGAPALASILTGLYPAEHGVHNNGASRYNASVRSLPQYAVDKGMATFFVSGGVPALRKAAISKGFTDFDDTIRVNGGFYRKATETLAKLANLVETRSEETPFLGVAQLVDLAFPEDVSFKSNREEGARGKLQEIDEALGYLRAEFSRLKIWDPLTVVIVGLQGNEGAEHGGLSKGLNLYDEVVRIPILIKPPRKPRDQGISWKVDEPITLVDLGQTLMRLMGVNDQNKGQFPSKDFLPALDGKEFQSDDRPLFTESDLPAWRGWGPRLVSVRVGEWVYWLPPDPKLFNSYTDHLELRNLINIDPNSVVRVQKVAHPFIQFLKELSSEEKDLHQLPYSVGDKLRVAKISFSKTTSLQERLRSLTELEMRRQQDWQVVQWHVSLLAEAQDWLAMKDVVGHRNPPDAEAKEDVEFWEAFLRLKLKLKGQEDEVRKAPLVNCLYLALALKRYSLPELEAIQNQPSNCKDQETQAWINAYVNYRLKRYKEAGAFFDLARSLTDKRVDQTEFGKLFWADGATWDYTLNLPEGPAVFSLFTALVTNPDFLEFIKKKQLP